MLKHVLCKITGISWNIEKSKNPHGIFGGIFYVESVFCFYLWSTGLIRASYKALSKETCSTGLETDCKPVLYYLHYNFQIKILILNWFLYKSFAQALNGNTYGTKYRLSRDKSTYLRMDRYWKEEFNWVHIKECYNGFRISLQ